MTHRFLFSVLASVAALSVSAQMTYDEVVATIVDNNPTLMSRQREIGAQRLDDTDANALANPSVDFARVWGRHGIGNKLQLDVSQSFDWPGLYSARSEAAELRQSAALMQLDAERADLDASVRALLIELVYVRQQIGIIRELNDSFSKLSAAIDSGVRGGELTVIDQRKMQIETYEVEGSLTAAQAREQQILAELQGLAAVPLDLSAITQYPVQPLLERQDYIDQIACEPQARAEDLGISQAEADERVASRSRMPGFSVGYQHQAEMGDRFNGFTVGLTLPVFQGRKARQAAYERKEAAEYSLQSVIARRTAEISATYDELLLQRERINKFNAIFGDHLYLGYLLKAYEGGQLSVIEYLSEVHYYHQTMLAHLDTEYAYHRALTALNRHY